MALTTDQRATFQAIYDRIKTALNTRYRLNQAGRGDALVIENISLTLNEAGAITSLDVTVNIGVADPDGDVTRVRKTVNMW